jgi:hypothetical protein
MAFLCSAAPDPLAAIDLGIQAVARLWCEINTGSSHELQRPDWCAAMALPAAQLYTAITCHGQRFEGQDPTELLGDLVADAFHLAAERDADPEELVERARRYVEEERGELGEPAARAEAA